MIALFIRRAVLALFPLACLLFIFEPACGGTQSDLQKIQALYDNTEYQKALEELAKL
ncbi:MAG: hypothetical protein HC801_08755, partial [Nitrospira sp.]|nr:hypothetical protein [Nitrospira sp.]